MSVLLYWSIDTHIYTYDGHDVFVPDQPHAIATAAAVITFMLIVAHALLSTATTINQTLITNKKPTTSTPRA